MLEDLALQYSFFEKDQVFLINYGMIVLGGILGGLTGRSQLELQRAPYFALTNLILFCTALIPATAVSFIVPAMANGYFWTVAGLDLLASAILGFFTARIARARSRDAYGHGRMAYLAFIPIGNVWLLLRGSRQESSINRAPIIPLLNGGLGVLAGLILFGLYNVTQTATGKEAFRRVEAAAATGAFDVALLDRKLAVMAAELNTPLAVDEVTILERVEAQGTELSFVYTLDMPIEFISVDDRLDQVRRNCEMAELKRAIDAGAKIRHVYLRKDGSEIGTITVDSDICN